MSKHKWYHFIGKTYEEGDYKNTILDPARTVTDHYHIKIEKCDICKEWKVFIHDYKKNEIIQRPWESRVRAMVWLKENNYSHSL